MKIEVVEHGNKYAGESVSCPECKMFIGYFKVSDCKVIRQVCPHCKALLNITL